jgi:hypothetical protein
VILRHILKVKNCVLYSGRYGIMLFMDILYAISDSCLFVLRISLKYFTLFQISLIKCTTVDDVPTTAEALLSIQLSPARIELPHIHAICWL